MSGKQMVGAILIIMDRSVEKHAEFVVSIMPTPLHMYIYTHKIKAYIYSLFILTHIFCFICIVSKLGTRCELLRKRRGCNDVKGCVTIQVNVKLTQCQDLCEHHSVNKWGCCKYQYNNYSCVFCDNSHEAPVEALMRYAAQCGSEG